MVLPVSPNSSASRALPWRARGLFMHSFASFRRFALGISPDETKFARRGFSAADPIVQQHLEVAGGSFITGYNTALAEPRPGELAARLDERNDLFRGFAFEGAAMALALLDLLTPWNRGRFRALCDSPAGERHWYLLFVGAGWAIARVPWARRNFERTMGRYDPLYRWLALDGYGFHEGFFHARQYVEQRQSPRRLSDHARRVFDQGLGRSLWFSHGGDAARLAATIECFAPPRRADLWSGVGLGSGYAGGVDRAGLEQVLNAAAGYEPQLAQGAAFAAKARQRAGNPVPHTALACKVYCRMSPEEAAAITDNCLENLATGDADAAEPAYQIWRRRIHERFTTAAPRGRIETGAAVPPRPILKSARQ